MLNKSEGGTSFITNDMHLSKPTEEISGERSNIPKAKLLPMSPLAASVTVVNLILATGPFT